MRVGQTHAWRGLPQRRPGLPPGVRPQAPVSAQAGGAAPFQPPGTRGLRPWATTWGLQAWQGAQPPKTAPARALARPQTGLSGSPGLASPLKPIWRGLRHLLQTGNRLPTDPKPQDCLSSSLQLPGVLTHPSRLRSLVLGGGSGGGGSFSGSFSRQYGGSAGRQPETDKQLNIQPGEETRSPPHSLVYREERV